MNTRRFNLFQSLYPLLSLLGILALGVLEGCNKKSGDPLPGEDVSRIEVYVYNHLGVRVDSATVNIFDSFENYELARLNNNNPSYAAHSFLSKSTIRVPQVLDGNKDYWILATKDDIVNGLKLTTALKTQRMDKLTKGSIYYMNLYMEADGGNIAFWAANTTNLPITVKIKGVNYTLNGSTPTAPTSPTVPGPPNALIIPLAQGVYPYVATSANGCEWTGQIDLSNGEFHTEQLETCNQVPITFYVPGVAPFNKGNIDIKVDNVLVGSLTGAFGSGTPTCGAASGPGVLTVYVAAGISHSYQAQSQLGGCGWSGPVTSIPVGGCQLVPLNPDPVLNCP